MTTDLFLQAILGGDRRAALSVANDALASGATVQGLYEEVLQASLDEVGRLWETNRITVAREHMATAVVQHVMAHLYSQIPPAAEARGSAIVTGVEGELHQVGAHMVADVLESDGWRVMFLGT